MKQSNQNKLHMLKEKSIAVKDWIMDNTKIVMPVVLVVCVLITIFVAINANQKEALKKEAEEAAAAIAGQEESASVEGLSTPVYELEENAYPEINNIIKTYYDAQASGDVETIASLNTYLNDIEKIRIQEMSKYIEDYPVLNVYTKPGLGENTYVAYVYSEVKFTDVDQELPGLKTYYIGQDGDGQYFINDGTYDDTVRNYIKEVTLQDDVVDLNNKVVVEYNDLLAEDDELNEYVAYLKEKINEDVGVILAKEETPDAEEAEGEAAEEETEGETEEPGSTDDNIVTTVTMVKATDVVNIRTSDSETADKIDKAQIGQEFKLLEQRGNGWSKVEYNGKDAYIKSEYLETVSEETVVDTGSAEAESTDADSGTVSGTVTVKENVKVRTSASTTADSLGTAYVGEKLDLIMKQADGWTKVKYKGQTAFVKSDYVE